MPVKVRGPAGAGDVPALVLMPRPAGTLARDDCAGSAGFPGAASGP